MYQSLTKDSLLDTFDSGVDLFIGHTSFESRSLSVVGALRQKCGKTIVFYVDQFSKYTKSNSDSFSKLVKNIDFVKLSHSNPIRTADSMGCALSEGFNPSETTAIDITTFTRENLLILMKILSSSYELRELQNLHFVYNCASVMSSEWLSRGISEQRSILGYSGEMLPSRNTHLVILAGFEIDRAKYLIDTYEPYSVSLGFGDPKESISNNFHNRNKTAINTLKDSYQEDYISEFTFSLLDPRSGALSIKEEVEKFDEFNIVLSPQNNKISSMAVGLVALSNPELQTVYTQMDEYNYEEYSKPSDKFFLFNASELFSPL